MINIFYILKIGDKPCCKVDYTHIDVIAFRKNIHYEVLNIVKDCMVFDSDVGKFVLNPLTVSEIFYSIKEMRLIKLDSLEKI